MLGSVELLQSYILYYKGVSPCWAQWSCYRVILGLKPTWEWSMDKKEWFRMWEWSMDKKEWFRMWEWSMDKQEWFRMWEWSMDKQEWFRMWERLTSYESEEPQKLQGDKIEVLMHL